MSIHTSELTPLTPADNTAGSIADGVWWIRLRLDDNSAQHVNVYLLDDGPQWVLVDTGTNTAHCRQALTQILATEPFCRKKVQRVIVTHYHPDHVGLAGWFADAGAQLVTTRTCWLMSSLMLCRDEESNHCTYEFLKRHAMEPLVLEAYRRRAQEPRFPRLVGPIPRYYQRIAEGDVLLIGDRQWTVHIGNGHASEHATLWSADGCALVGDQIIAGLSPSLHVYPSEPDADVLGEWIESCGRLAELASPDVLCLPGHNQPFTNAPLRCAQLASSHEAISNRLFDTLVRPRTTAACVPLVVPQRTGLGPSGLRNELAILNTVAYLNYGMARGELCRELIGEQYIWRRTS